ncbi:MAG: metal ABC transporter ATP-binding protein [Acidimicrobiia bacterium]|nr:metal ABC transporter ATP-binding protein [Acidimicrobiia bacterium]
MTAAANRPCPGAAVVAEALTLARGGNVALSDASFSIAAGTVSAVIGPNGAGKSTLLHAIAGLLAPAAGTLEVLGRTAGPGSSDVAYVLQGTRVHEHLPVSVREVVAMGRYAALGPFRRMRPGDDAAISSAMERLDIADLASRQIRELSGGQRQRVFVAQGIAQEAPVLLLDEPVTGLDLVSRRRILEVVTAERVAGRAVVMTTHDLGEAAHADHVLLLAGRVVASGPPEEVLVSTSLAEAYGQRLVHLGDNVVMLDDAPHHHHPH